MMLDIAKEAGLCFAEIFFRKYLDRKQHTEFNALRTTPIPSAEWQNHPDVHRFICIEQSIEKTVTYEKTRDILPILFGESCLKPQFEKVPDYLKTLSDITPMDAFLLAKFANLEDQVARYYNKNGKTNENVQYAWDSWNTLKNKLAEKLNCSPTEMYEKIKALETTRCYQMTKIGGFFPIHSMQGHTTSHYRRFREFLIGFDDFISKIEF